MEEMKANISSKKQNETLQNKQKQEFEIIFMFTELRLNIFTKQANV